MADRKTKDRGRVRQQAAQNKKPANKEDWESSQKANVEKIATAIHAIEQELNRANDDSSPKKKREWNWERDGIIGLWIAAFVGLAAVVVGSMDSGAQRGAMQRQLDELRDEQRPWIGITVALDEPKAGLPLKLSVQYINVGHKPAFKVAVYAMLKPWPVGPIEEIPANILHGEEGGNVFLPGMSSSTRMKIDNDAPVNQAFIDELKSNPNKLWLVARAEYVDGDNKPHFTSIRVVYSPIVEGFTGFNPGNDAN
jgi:hypothetical protein